MAGDYGKQKLIGLSLSACVRDIAMGRVDISQVIRIISGTYSPDDRNWELLLTGYAEDYWWECADEAKRIARFLRAHNMLSQPRNWGQLPPDRSTGHWREIHDDS